MLPGEGMRKHLAEDSEGRTGRRYQGYLPGQGLMGYCTCTEVWGTSLSIWGGESYQSITLKGLTYWTKNKPANDLAQFHHFHAGCQEQALLLSEF